MNKIYGFEGEVKAKYSAQMFQLFTEVFHTLPLSYVLGGKVIVLHGGLFSRDDVTLADVRRIDRKREPPDEGLMSELLWSDPQARGCMYGRICIASASECMYGIALATCAMLHAPCAMRHPSIHAPYAM